MRSIRNLFLFPLIFLALISTSFAVESGVQLKDFTVYCELESTLEFPSEISRPDNMDGLDKYGFLIGKQKLIFDDLTGFTHFYGSEFFSKRLPKDHTKEIKKLLAADRFIIRISLIDDKQKRKINENRFIRYLTLNIEIEDTQTKLFVGSAKNFSITSEDTIVVDLRHLKTYDFYIINDELALDLEYLGLKAEIASSIKCNIKQKGSGN